MLSFFSIITATYNAAPHLPRLLASLAEQTCRDFELIIQDGASTDETLAILESWEKRIPFLDITSEKDTGIYDAWNKAIARSKGQWILFLGADDALYSEDTLARVHIYIQNILDNIAAGTCKREAPLFMAGGIAISCEDSSIRRFVSGTAEDAVERLHSGGIPTPFPGLFIARKLFLTHSFDTKWRIAGDFDFLCKNWKRNEMGISLPFFVTNMREGGISTQYKYASLCFKENMDISAKHFGTSVDWKKRLQYFRSIIVSNLYTHVPSVASQIHNTVRMLCGKQPINLHKKLTSSLPVVFKPEAVPIFIISYNRLEYLQKLIMWLEKAKLTNIIIVDNNSSYPPLLDYLSKLPYQVVKLSENLGHLAVWKCGLFSKILTETYYIVSDPDVMPIDSCPPDIISILYNQLIAYPEITKSGPCLLLDDIPEGFPLRDTVFEMERRFWKKKTSDNIGYFAHIDTTFALYKPGIFPEDQKWFNGVRLAPPYAARHLPWYENPATPSKESLFYQSTTKPQSSLWSVHDAKALKLENMRLREKVTHLEDQLNILSKSWGNRFTLIFFKILRSIKHRFFA